MVEIGDIEGVIRSVAIGINNAVGLDFTCYYGDQGVCPGVLDVDGINPPTAFQKTKHNDLARHPRFFAHATDGKSGRRIAVNFDQQTGRSGRCPGNEVFKQLVGLKV